MKKDNILFGVIGVLLGLIIGFLGANSLNKSASNNAVSTASGNSNIPADHPPIGGSGGPTMDEITATVDKAKNSPQDFDAQVKAADVYTKIGRYADAVAFLTQANALKPEDIDVQILLGNALFDSEKYVEAADWYAKALAERPDAIEARTDLGITFMLREPADVDKAIAEFEKALKSKPGHLNTLQNLTFAYIKKPDVAKARATLAEAERLGAEADDLKRLREELAKIEEAAGSR
jgi:tetratricopeptide (TPR) repeat protein